MASNPAFVATPRIGMGQVAAANTARDGSGTVVTIITGAAGGTRIHEVNINAAGTVTAGVVRLFLYDGTNYRLFDEILVTAITPSTTIATYRARRVYEFLYLPDTTWSVRASTHNAETLNIFALAGDL